MTAPPSAAGDPGTATPNEAPAEDPERKWLREVYQGASVPQLTVRAVLTGMVLGGFMSLSNLYIALKTGWSFGVTITAGIMGFAFWKVVRAALPRVRDFGMLENNAMQSVASAAGYMTGGGTVAALPALMVATHTTLPWYVVFLWITAIAILGVFMAIPMKRQMINHEQLKFPSGIAAAETLRSLHAHGEEARLRSRALLGAGALGAFVKWWSEAYAAWLPYPHLPARIALPFKIKGLAAAQWSWFYDTSLLLVAAGAIMGWRSAWSLMLGAVLNFGFLAPYGHAIGAIHDPVGYPAIVKWTVWFGSSLLLTAGLLSFAFSWRQVARSFADVGSMFRVRRARPALTEPLGAGAYRVGQGEPTPDPMAAIEVPMRWFVLGNLVMAPVVTALAWLFFGMTWWMGAICIVLSFFIAIVACRSTGETDTTPTGALGKITQLVFGVVAPGSVTINLMSANLAGGVAIHSADLLTDLKSGYLLGARPRQQFFAQFFGVLAGSMFVVPAFRLFVPDWTVIGTDAVPAPGALAWGSVAQVLAGGLSQLPVSARWLIAAGGTTGIVLTLLEKSLPRYKRFIPSPIGFGLAFTMPAYNSISMFIGALIALGIERNKPKVGERYIIPVSSGIIAGESLTGIVIKVLVMLHVLHEATAGH